ncbi:hypothetical protein M404DRAFT_994358 [Pisolithus tinctorius Marx 270]|uniref:Uncharacterized protein n=1 Tax=Pisolithus tinctorius Marx 270 TaxID=870435 RepID=A0A0C3KPT0_PISTI|nr:hypothetical protein M404DRAFT_994358 [Pisolithus tinctorius Marx 270]
MSELIILLPAVEEPRCLGTSRNAFLTKSTLVYHEQPKVGYCGTKSRFTPDPRGLGS